MGATTTQGTGNGSAEKILGRIQNQVKNANLAVNAVEAANIANAALVKAPAVLNAAAITIDSSFANKPLVFDRAAGVIATLPAASGSGNVYKFFVKTTVTSNNYIVKVANASDAFVGRAIACADGGNGLNGWEVGSGHDTITLNGTTSGGYVGDTIEIVDIATNVFVVNAFINQTGTEETPFSATVS